MSNFMPMLYAFWDSDITYSFRKSRVAVISALVLLAMFLTAIFAPSLAPQDPFNIAELDLFDSELPPAWDEGGSAASYPAGSSGSPYRFNGNTSAQADARARRLGHGCRGRRTLRSRRARSLRG